MAAEYIGGDSGSTKAALVVPIAPDSVMYTYKARVQTEVRSTEGAALWVLRGFSKLEDKPGHPRHRWLFDLRPQRST